MLRRMHSTRSQRQRGQALVELALALTFIGFLLSAAVDLGLAFKTYQGLVNATAEASSYLAQKPLLNNSKADANNQAVTNFRLEAGENDGKLHVIGSMRDLNANGLDDNTCSGGGECLTLLGDYIRINEASDDQFSNGFDIGSFTPTSDSNCVARKRLSTDGDRCYIVVRARAIYRPFFPLAPVFGEEVTIRAYAVKPIVGDN